MWQNVHLCITSFCNTQYCTVWIKENWACCKVPFPRSQLTICSCLDVFGWVPIIHQPALAVCLTEYQTFNAFVWTFAALLRVIKCLTVGWDKMWVVSQSFCTTWQNNITVWFKGIWACWILPCFHSIFWHVAPALLRLDECQNSSTCSCFKTAPACACLKLCSSALCNQVPGCNVWQFVMYYIIL